MYIVCMLGICFCAYLRVCFSGVYLCVCLFMCVCLCVCVCVCLCAVYWYIPVVCVCLCVCAFVCARAFVCVCVPVFNRLSKYFTTSAYCGLRLA